jgi:hypothetical protein
VSEPREALSFPCELPIKAIGHWAEDFEGHVLDLVRRHAVSAEPEPARARVSRSGRYLAITMRVALDSRERMDALYRALSDDPRVRWAL